MKRASLTGTLAFSLAAMLGAACSANDTITPASSSASGTTTTGTSGTTTTGTSGSAGTAPTSGGSTATAGSTGTGGSTTGGSTGDSGSSTGGSATSGSGTGGSSGGTGGATSGGSAGTGGAGGGSAGTGGGGPTGECTGDCSAVLGKLDGWANIDPPSQVTGPDGIQGLGAKDNVPTTMCATTETRPDHGLPFKEAHWQLKGPGIVAGTNYKVTIQFTGVVECKTYQSLAKCPQPANQGRDATYNMWCPGGMDPPLTSQPDHYNTVMLSVTPQSSATTPNLGPNTSGPLPAADNWWMLNECPQGVTEFHRTWKIDYPETIVVPGESWINFVEFDTNCREIRNCGNSDDANQTCTQQYTLTPQGAVPAPPASITTQPASAGGGGFGQWLYFDVKSVVKM